MVEKNKNLYQLILISTLIFTFVAHAHAYLNLFFSHDSLWLNIMQGQSFHDTHGRFFLRFLTFLTGGLTLPFLQGIFSILFYTFSTYILVCLLNLQNKKSIIGICAIFSTTPIWTIINAGYIFNLDYFALATLITMMGIYISKKYNFIFSIPFFVCALGTYQSFIHVATVIFLILLIKEIIDNKSFHEVLFSGLKSLFVLVISMITYYGVIKFLNPADLASYRNYNSVGDYSDVNLLKLFALAYVEPLKMLFEQPYVFESLLTKKLNILAFVNAFLACITCFCLTQICLTKKIKKINICLLIGICILMPFGMGFLYFVAKEYTGPVSYLSITYFFVLALFSVEKYTQEIDMLSKNYKISTRFITYIVALCIIINVHSNVIFANQIYVYKDLNSSATLSLYTRVAQQIENFVGYIPGETPVLFIGTPNLNPNYNHSTLHSLYDSREQLKVNSVIRSAYYTPTYFSSILGINNLPYLSYSSEEVTQIKNLKEVKNMPIYPHAKALKIINGVLVVKISNE